MLNSAEALEFQYYYNGNLRSDFNR